MSGDTTAALYPEVAAILDAPDRIRREAAELLGRGVMSRSVITGSVIFRVDRPAAGDRPETTITIEIPDRGTRFPNARAEAHVKLIEILEAEERRGNVA